MFRGAIISNRGTSYSIDFYFPLDFIYDSGNFYILDGLHRLARLKLENAPQVKVRKHSIDVID
jgi:hypothetical protein